MPSSLLQCKTPTTSMATAIKSSLSGWAYKAHPIFFSSFFLFVLFFAQPVCALLWFGPSNGWHVSKISSPCSEHSSTRIYYSNCSPLNGMTAEIVMSCDRANFILNLHWCPISTPSLDRHAPVSITPTNLPTRTFYPYCCIGNQKLIFSDQDTKVLIHKLLLGHSITFSVGMYETCLPPNGFIGCWNRI